MQKVLVTGGSGYIGSHTLVSLIEAGFDVVSADNHVNSYPTSIASVEKITGAKVHHHEIDLCDPKATADLFSAHPDIYAVIHFAALKAVGESVQQPLRYFKNNINSLLNVLSQVEEHKVEHFIFSSSCTVYGQASELPVTEQTEMKDAESPYGRTKQIGEYILKDFSAYKGLNVLSLRYFNPAGAHHTGLIGEAPKVEALNLVPVITETAIGRRDLLHVHGADYDTRDGSCIRDYIHVMDLADAHTKALQYMIRHKGPVGYEVFNLGIGAGVSVLEAIKAFEHVSGQALNYKIGPRRPGDVVAIYANFDKARNLLGWSPQYGIEDIMRSAWQWEQKRAVN